MPLIDHSEEELERVLLASAQGDDLPTKEATDRAYAELSAALAALAVQAPTPTLPTPTPRVGFSGSAVKWLAIGALAGGLGMFLAMGRAPNATEMPGIVAPPSATTSAAEPSPTTSGPAELAPPPVPPTAHVVTSTLAAPSLAAEVAAIDRARSDLARGSAAGALERVAAYRRDFPNGKLRPEADVVAIEALARKGDRTAVSREAARFLARYPTAPERERVEQLAKEP